MQKNRGCTEESVERTHRHLASRDSCNPGTGIPRTPLQLAGLPFRERCGSRPTNFSIRAYCLAYCEASDHAISLCAELVTDPPNVVADRVQLQQVLMNLMLNGIDAMKESGGELSVRTRRSEEGLLTISISDTGTGLPAGKEDEIFKAFFTTKPQGSGMGLAISRSIVESHGGRLWATSQEGQGTTFHFTVPITRVETAIRA